MATIKYYELQNGVYMENPEGQLVGIEWSDAGGNLIRAILFFMDFSTLVQEQEISFMYQVEVLPEGQTTWLLRDRQVFKITNSVLIDPAELVTLTLSQILRRRSTVVVDPAAPPPTDPVGQLDYFVDIYLKGGKYPPGQLLPMYEWLAEIIADLEGQTI
jgi:hypothetical protein